jgi:glycosyltransferase involved in cell wall biosynthesis
LPGFWNDMLKALHWLTGKSQKEKANVPALIPASAVPPDAPAAGNSDGLPHAARKRIIFDISDLVQFLRESRIPSGIQRVQLNIIHYVVTDFRDEANPIIVYFDQAQSEWVHISEPHFLALYKATEAHDETDEEAFQALMRDLAAGKPLAVHLAALGSRDQFFLANIGSSWWIENYFIKLRELRKHHDLRYVPMIHDCIPLMVPEHCPAALVEDFRLWFFSAMLEADAVITNSQWSAKDIRQNLNNVLPDAQLPIHPIALNGDMRSHLAARDLACEELIRHILPMRASFILCVGTLERRKNHLLLFKAWTRLMERHGMAATPYLICLGRAGWLFDEAAEYLRTNAALHERILLISSVTDGALAALYADCLFSISNSFYEGWGLPITESLSFGTLPLVAHNTSLTEAGGQAATYFLDNDLSDLIEKLETLILDHATRQALREQACAKAHIRDWRSIAHDFTRHILATEPKAAIRKDQFLRLPPGRLIHLGKAPSTTSPLEAALGSLLRDGLNWHRPEDWGSWTKPGVASISVPLPDPLIEQDLLLCLRLRGPAFATQIKINFFADGQHVFGPIAREIGRGKRLGLWFHLRTKARELHIDIDGGAGTSLGPNDRDVGIGVTHLMLCHTDDAEARKTFLKAFPEFGLTSRLKGRATLERIEIPIA